MITILFNNWKYVHWESWITIILIKKYENEGLKVLAVSKYDLDHLSESMH